MEASLHQLVLAEVVRVLDPLLELSEDVRTVEPLDAFRDPSATTGATRTVLAHGLFLALEEMGLADGFAGNMTETLLSLSATLNTAISVIRSESTEDSLGAVADVLRQLEDTIQAFEVLVRDLDPSVTLEQTLDAVWKWLVWRRLQSLSTALAAVAEFAGIVRAPSEASAGVQIDSGALKELATDPLELLRRRIGWGDRLEIDELLGIIERIAKGVGIGAYQVFADGSPGDPLVPVLRLRLAQADDYSEAGLALSADDPDDPRGLAIVGYGVGALSMESGSGDLVSVTLKSDATAEDLPTLVMTPSGMSVRSGSPALDGMLDLEIEASRLDGDPITLLSLGPLGAITAGGVSLRVGTGLDGSGAAVEFSITSGRLTAAGGSSDGFLSSILPKDGFFATFDVGATWTAREGIRFKGSGALGIDVAVMDGPLGMVSVNALRFDVLLDGASVGIEASAAVSAKLGPVAVTVDGLGVRALIGSATEPGVDLTIGSVGFDLKPRPPKGLGLSINMSVIRAGGYLDVSPGRYAGALELSVGELALAAFGLIETRMPDGSDGFSMLLFVSGRFAPVQLGFGFTLLGMGGLLGIHRDVDPDALFAAVRAGTVGDLLSPEDPVRDAPRLIALAEGIFPARRGQYVFGPTVQLGWGTPTLLSLDLALAATLPEPLRIVLIGRLSGTIPAPEAPILKITVDLAGVLDLSGGRLALEGRLHDSSVQLIPIEGGFALRSAWGAEQYLLFSLGGLHPAFEPPPDFRDLPRMGTDLSKGRALKLTMSGYFAITSNTIQIGASVDLRVSAAGFTLLGGMGFDALVEFEPFRMQVDIHARVQVMRGRRSLFKLSFRGRLSGPNPWHIRGHATIEIPILPDVRVGASATFGTERTVPSTPVDVAALVRNAIGRAQAWRGDGPPAGLIPAPGSPTGIDPRGSVRLLQDVAPLGRNWQRFHGKSVAGARGVRLGTVMAGGQPLDQLGPLDALFSPGAFRDMSEAERLSAPGFELMLSGARLGGAAAEATGSSTPKLETRETLVLGPRTASAMPSTAPAPPSITRAAPPVTEVAVRVRPETWRATGPDGAPRGPATDWAAARAAGASPILDVEVA